MLQQLYPLGQNAECKLEGCYLKFNLHQQAAKGEVFIYANYISSLDGRIALFDEHMGEYAVPKAIANPRDWRLYQELAGQSDVMLTSARYFRQLAVGKAQDLLPVGSGEKFADIELWRQAQGLKAQPDVVILSDSLDIPLPALEGLNARNVFVFTSKQLKREKIEKLTDAGVTVLESDGPVTGQFIKSQLIQLGFKSAYMIAGPKVHHTLLVDDCLDELFLTSHFTILGGRHFLSDLDDELKAKPMQLQMLYLDNESQQMFMRFTYKDC